VSFAETKTTNYDTKQLIRDVAVLYRQHKLAESVTSDQLNAIASSANIATNAASLRESRSNKRATSLTKKSARKASTLAKAKKRKARKLARAKKLLKSRKKAKSSKVAKRKNTGSFKRQMTVTATAYTSHVNQTDSTPNIAAWGDRLKPGMKVIAVSRDMLNLYGLKHRSKVRIKGLDGEYRVLDKMNKRWKKKIDIYMGKDLKKAFKWGRKKVELQWN